ncbi:DUF4996 domain-containing protein [Rhizobium leguminosarum]|uniref:DUF4996 domain-containing protein n=1 Tax=Rhizobium leguminosarum TaxID=384 RepID=UPI001FDEB986|nr:DUF4996 domain-containing protein [Rhizobium leguminosarum]
MRSSAWCSGRFSGGLTDSAALEDPDAIWGRMMAAGISVIQTDQPAALKAYIEARRA